MHPDEHYQKGFAHFRAGEHHRAWLPLLRAKAGYEELDGTNEQQSCCHGLLGMVHLNLGHYRHAANAFSAQLGLIAGLADYELERANCLYFLGVALQLSGDLTQAAAVIWEASALFRELGQVERVVLCERRLAAMQPEQTG